MYETGLWAKTMPIGVVAQRLEQGAHNALVGGSNPSRPTIFICTSLLYNPMCKFRSACFTTDLGSYNKKRNLSGEVPMVWYWGYIFCIAALLIFLEFLKPGRTLPQVSGWYMRAIFLNACQLALTLTGGVVYHHAFGEFSVFNISELPSPAQGFIAWFIGTFIFYWWHRLRHESRLCWLIFHQIHHSPARIEVLTSFYKHPIEIFVNTLLSSAIIYCLLGCSWEAAVWYNIFAASGEMFYHSNLSTPRWIGYFIQRPEHHSIHHQYKLHRYNYSDIPLWDKLFGTFKEAERGVFAPKCGYNDGKEQQLFKMLLFRNNY